MAISTLPRTILSTASLTLVVVQVGRVLRHADLVVGINHALHQGVRRAGALVRLIVLSLGGVDTVSALGRVGHLILLPLEPCSAGGVFG